MPRGLVIFAGSERRLLSYPDSPPPPPPSRECLINTRFLPIGLSLAPQPFMKCMDAAISQLRQLGIRILNYLNDWLILAQSEDELLYHRSMLLSHLECLGLRVNFAKNALSPSQWISFLGTVIDSARMRAVIMPERALAIQQLAASFKPWVPRSSKHFRGCLASWPQHLRYFSWACFTCGPFSTGWNLEFLYMLGITDASVSRWARPALQLWPLGRTVSGWNGPCPWAWAAEGRWSRQTLPT